MIFVRPALALLVAASALTATVVRADTRPPLTLAAEASQPHLLVLRQQGAGALPRLVARDQDAEARILDARDALAERAAGAPLKAVYVVAREAGRYEVLVVREAVLAERADDVARLVAAFEQARRWIVANPAETSALVAGSAGETAARKLAARDFTVARPGPALEQALSSAVDRAQARALVDDGPLRAAAGAGRESAATRVAGLR
jgi:hypothetical protein